MEMLEILKARLPEGLKIIKVKERPGYSQAEIRFEYDGTESIGWLYKTCAPGKENHICDFSICAVMANIALSRNDVEMAKFWLDKQLNLGA